MSELNQLSFKVLSLGDLDLVYGFGLDQLKTKNMDPIEQELMLWSVPWRKESLEHYLKLGWSFGAFDHDKLVGYSLGQPFLFFASETQTLWVEHLAAASSQISERLTDVCIRWGRDKHFQRVVFNQKLNVPEPFKKSEQHSFGEVVVKTTKSN